MARPRPTSCDWGELMVLADQLCADSLADRVARIAERRRATGRVVQARQKRVAAALPAVRSRLAPSRAYCRGVADQLLTA